MNKKAVTWSMEYLGKMIILVIVLIVLLILVFNYIAPKFSIGIGELFG